MPPPPISEAALKRRMLRALLERPGQRMSSWPFQDEEVPDAFQYKAIRDLIADAPRDVQAFDGSPKAETDSEENDSYKPNDVRLTRSGIEWAREHLSQELAGSWQERSSDYLEALRSMDSDDRRRSVVPGAFDNGMAAVSRLVQMPAVRHLLSVFSFLAGVTEGLTRSTSRNFWFAYVWRAVKIAVAIKLALAASSLLPFGGELLRDAALGMIEILEELTGGAPDTD